MAKWPADEENKSRKGKTTGKTCKPFWLDSLTSSVFDHLVGFTGEKKKSLQIINVYTKPHVWIHLLSHQVPFLDFLGYFP